MLGFYRASHKNNVLSQDIKLYTSNHMKVYTFNRLTSLERQAQQVPAASSWFPPAGTPQRGSWRPGRAPGCDEHSTPAGRRTGDTTVSMESKPPVHLSLPSPLLG